MSSQGSTELEEMWKSRSVLNRGLFLHAWVFKGTSVINDISDGHMEIVINIGCAGLLKVG